MTPARPRGATPTKQRIFETAVELFSREGYSAVSVRDLTRAVGIKESSLYNHFASKEGILEAIYQHFQAEMGKVKPPSNLPELLATVPTEVLLRKGFERFLDVADTPLMARIYRILVVEQFRDPRARDLMEGLFEFPLAAATQLFEAMTQDAASLSTARRLAITYQYALHALVAQYSLKKHHGLDTHAIEQRISEHIAGSAALIDRHLKGASQ
jgi:AcrR family transcriptional regulator